MTETTDAGKYVRMSPNQRATAGDERAERPTAVGVVETLERLVAPQVIAGQ